jgi:hypothetical protein
LNTDQAGADEVDHGLMVISYKGMSLPNRSCLGRSQMIDHPAVGTAHVWPVPAMMQAYTQSLFVLQQMHGLICLHTWYQD